MFLCSCFAPVMVCAPIIIIIIIIMGTCSSKAHIAYPEFRDHPLYSSTSGATRMKCNIRSVANPVQRVHISINTEIKVSLYHV